MATLNIVLDTRRKRKDGTYNIVFRISLGSKFKDISTGFNSTREEFNIHRAEFLFDQKKNEQLFFLKTHYYHRLKDYSLTNLGREDLTDLKKYLLNKSIEEVTILSFWEVHINEMLIAGRGGGARTYRTSLATISNEVNLKVLFKQFTYKDVLTLENVLARADTSFKQAIW
jgi:hypothetical protein